jgi:hypothetical protein
MSRPMQPPRPVHAIRLQAAWEPPTSDTAPWIRRFGRPAGVAAGQRVWLVVAGAVAPTAVSLNGIALPVIAAGQPRWAHDITSHLQDRNVLEMVAAPLRTPDDADRGGTRRPAPAAFGAIGLEITAVPEGPATVAPTMPPHRA